MILKKSPLLKLVTFTPQIHEDHRGTFVEHFNLEGIAKAGFDLIFVRDCFSTSSKNVLRGIHYDDKTWKLIQCLSGEIYFVVVNMEPESPDYLKWESFTLSDRNRTQVLVPPMYGNGHLVLSDRCIFHYKMTEYYDPAGEKILKWDDPRTRIDWPAKDPILSEKDELGYNPQRDS
jgi:dTDP-4-dehydrorhamnose 3,5-epimerase